MPKKAVSPALSPTRVALLGGAFLVLASVDASASPTYPALVKGYFELAEAPACTLCHQTDQGGYATLNASVGKYLGTTLGLVPKLAEADLNRYLEQWGDRQDSDGDKAFDLDELKAGTDPNDADDKPAGAGGAGGAGGSAGAAGAKAEKGAGGTGGVVGATGDEGSGEAPLGSATQATCSVSAAPGAARSGGGFGGWAGLALGLAALVRARPQRAWRPSRARPAAGLGEAR